MKKTRSFIFITALLITLLIVVGCDVSPVSTRTDNLVLASISVREARALVSNGEDDTLSEVNHFTCYLDHLWSMDETDDTYTENIYGDREIIYEKIAEDGVLGWVTPGKWKVTVYGYNNGGIPIFVGTTEVYFSPTNSTATVFMTPLKNTGTITIDINQPMLSSNPYEYNYIYKVIDSSGNIAVSNGNRVEGVIEIDTTKSNNITGNYKATISDLSFDMYAVAIYCYRNSSATSSQINSVSEIEKGELIGGAVKKVFLCFSYNQPFTITGSLDFSDFVKADLDSSSIVVSGSLTSSISGKTANFTLKDNTNTNGSTSFNFSYQWYVNGVLMQDSTSKVFSHSFEYYGPKEVSCVIVYKSETEVYSATVKETFTLTPSASV